MRALTAIAAVGIVVVCGGLGHLLTRIDHLRAEQGATAAQVRLVGAKLELARAELLGIVHRDVKPDNLAICVRRTNALRAAIFALARIGNASMVNDPGWDWAAWPLELAEAGNP